MEDCVIRIVSEEVARIREGGDFDHRIATITRFPLGALTFDYGVNAFSFDETLQTLIMSELNIFSKWEISMKATLQNGKSPLDWHISTRQLYFTLVNHWASTLT